MMKQKISGMLLVAVAASATLPAADATWYDAGTGIWDASALNWNGGERGRLRRQHRYRRFDHEQRHGQPHRHRGFGGDGDQLRVVAHGRRPVL